jgi:two-component system, OmpR family, response regulator
MTPANEPALPSAQQAAGPEGSAPRVLLVEADTPLIELLDTWLAAEGWRVITESDDHPVATEPADLVIVDVPFPRQGGVDLIRRIASSHPMTPILALSSTFFAGIECCGPVARELGVACVLPQPASREALIQAVRRLLSR